MATNDSKFWLKFALAAVALFVCIALAFLCGCKSFYENSGSAVRVGTLTAPIDISDGSDTFNLRLLYSMDGAYAYTRKDSKVTVSYLNVWTNSYIGCIETTGSQNLIVEVEPLDMGGGDPEPSTNTTSLATTSLND